MITYEPLITTLSKKKMTIGELSRRVGDRGLKRKFNTRRFIGLSTLDRICSVLECKVEDVIIYSKGEQELLENWVMGYIVNWGKVKELLKGKSFYKASLELGMKGSYLGNVSKNKKSRRPLVLKLAKYLGCEPLDFATPIRFELNKGGKDDNQN